MTPDLPSFLEIKTDKSKSPWCVDGRPDFSKPKGPQMLGASLHPVVLKAVAENLTFEEQLLSQSFQTLQEAGFALGVHWGSHKHGELSDCGFADRMPEIIRKAQTNNQEIINRLLKVYQNHQTVFQLAYAKINAFASEKIQLKGGALIERAQNLGAQVINLEGDHQERAAFVNLKEGVTLDTNRLNQQGKQAFNLDLWMVVGQAKKLNLNPDFALGASLILYQATEMVLVEDKGKAPLPIIIHAPGLCQKVW